MPTGIRVTRRLDGTREFCCYEQKNSNEEVRKKAILESSSPSVSVDSQSIDDVRKLEFKNLPDLYQLLEAAGLIPMMLKSEDAECALCPGGKPGTVKHIHVFLQKLSIINPYYEQKLPPLKAVYCSSCSKKLAYVCTGPCVPGLYDLYCSDDCQKANWDNHKVHCSADTTTTGTNTSGSPSQLDLQNLTIQDKTSTPNQNRRLPIARDNFNCSPKAVAEHINSSIIVRHESADKKKTTVDTIIQQDNKQQLRQDIVLGNLRQPNAAIKKTSKPIDPFEALPRGLVMPGKRYVTCVLCSDEHSVFLSFDNDKLKEVMEKCGTLKEEIASKPVSRDVAIGTTHFGLSFDDSNWYRAMVTETMGNDEFKVYYIDFGSEEVLPRERLRDLFGAGLVLTDTPAIAIKCEFSSDSNQEAMELALQGEETFNMFVDFYDEEKRLYGVTLL